MSLERPDYYDPRDRELYEELMRKNEMTEAERRFCIDMYHKEEVACGLDGD